MKELANRRNEVWLRLDNAAKIYPAIRSPELTAVFRISVDLAQRVKVAAFLDAVNAIENRFPYYKVRLRTGFFWYYLEYSALPIAVKADTDRPCRDFNKRELMFRVLARENTISVEFSHILTDATGAFEFLKSLLLVYFEKCGIAISPEQAFLRPGETPANEEYEDAYSRYFKKGPSSLIQVRKAFHLPFTVKKTSRFNVLTAMIPLDETSGRSRHYGVSLTEYFIAVYLFSLQQVYENLPLRSRRGSNRIFRIEVPVNLRRMLPTRTMRNFTLYVLPEIDLRLGAYTFEEIIKTVYHQMRLETDQKLINKVISRNVGSLNNHFVRRVPLFIKSFLLSRFYAIGTSRYSGVVTNLGKIDIAPDINSQMDNFKFIPPPPNKILKVNCGIVGFGNKIALSFGNITSSRELEKAFLKFLTDDGVHVQTI
ncbi:MAG TPA: hypothetical protein VFX43_02905 [Chitinophagaceae bacterium]|jgi:NRPS condensation-like uncharacterized protein|nr:hypothetical protein [Chitinophagaceae bacterium]